MITHIPKDMTVTVSSEVTLADLQAQLAVRGQWLPVDPPGALTIRELLDSNASGPRRFGYGTVREHLIGIHVKLPDGRMIKAGGKVVKNVAGYDLCKLFVGARGELGEIVEATFKLLPLPEVEQFVEINCDSLNQAGQIVERVLHSEITPVVLDLHNVTALQVVLGFAGARESVEWQVAQTRKLGAHPMAGLHFEERFWRDKDAGQLRRLSVLPSKVTEVIASLGDVEFVARAGNGLIWYRGGPESPSPDVPVKLMQRIKDAYNPNHILPT